MLTPIDIQNQTLKTSMRGYNKNKVRERQRIRQKTWKYSR